MRNGSQKHTFISKYALFNINIYTSSYGHESLQALCKYTNQHLSNHTLLSVKTHKHVHNNMTTNLVRLTTDHVTNIRKKKKTHTCIYFTYTYILYIYVSTSIEVTYSTYIIITFHTIHASIQINT